MVYMVCTRVKKSSRTVVVRRPYVKVCVCKYMVDVYLQKEGQHGWIIITKNIWLNISSYLYIDLAKSITDKLSF